MSTLHRLLVISFIAVPACATESADEDGPDKSELGNDTSGKFDGIDWCEARDYYGDGECDRFCHHHDSDCPLLGPEPAGSVTRYPIVLHHGFAGGRTGMLAYKGVAEALVADGNRVVTTTVPPFDSILVRAAALKAAVDSTLASTGAAKVNIIAHSMGGLDARHLISVLGYGDRVASLTTISTPHRGTLGGDVGLGLIPNIADGAVDALAAIFGAKISGTDLSTNVRAALTDLSVGQATVRNAQTPDDPDVYYQSWAGVSSLFGIGSEHPGVAAACDGKLLFNPGTFDRMRVAYVPLIPVISNLGTELQDGLVTISSAKWGDFKGCIPADHSDEVGQQTAGVPDPRTDFDAGRFYRQVADDLAARGF